MSDASAPIWCLSGWATPADSLREIAPEAWHIPYGDLPDVTALWHLLSEHQHYRPLVVGWSLGGQLAARAVSEGVLNPRAMLLLAAPYQFLATPERPAGMGPSTYALFAENYAKDPVRTAARFAGLIAQGDAEPKRIIAALELAKPLMADASRWQPWLTALAEWKPHRYGALPRTRLIHGKNDAVVPSGQTTYWTGVEVVTYDACGHAPHLSDPARTRALLEGLA